MFQALILCFDNQSSSGTEGRNFCLHWYNTRSKKLLSVPPQDWRWTFKISVWNMFQQRETIILKVNKTLSIYVNVYIYLYYNHFYMSFMFFVFVYMRLRDVKRQESMIPVYLYVCVNQMIFTWLNNLYFIAIFFSFSEFSALNNMEDLLIFFLYPYYH